MDIVETIINIEVIARGANVRARRRLQRRYGGRGWRKIKGEARVCLVSAYYAKRRSIGMKRMASAGRNSKSRTSSREMSRPSRAKSVVVARCLKKGEDCGDLHLATLYPVIADKAAAQEGYLRVIDDSGDDYLYPADFFVLRKLPASLARKIRQRAC